MPPVGLDDLADFEPPAGIRVEVGIRLMKDASPAASGGRREARLDFGEAGGTENLDFEIFHRVRAT